MTCSVRKSTAIILTLTLGSFFFTRPAFSDSVIVEEIPKEGFARIKFTWPSPVPFIARLVDKKLKISFARRIELNLENFPNKLQNYIGRPQLFDAGNTLVFPTKNDFGLNFNSRGRIITIDLVDLSPTSSSLTRDISSLAKSEKVNVRGGQHRDYKRLVFDWKKRVSYKLEQKDNRAILIFGRAARFNVSKLKKRLKQIFTSFSSEIKTDKTFVKFRVPGKSRLRHFVTGSKVVIDIVSSDKIMDVKDVHLSNLKHQKNAIKKPHRLDFKGQPNARRLSSKSLRQLPLRNDATKSGKVRDLEAESPSKAASPNQHPILVPRSPKSHSNRLFHENSNNRISESTLSPMARLNKSFNNRDKPFISLGFTSAKAQTATPKALLPGATTGGRKILATIRFAWTEPVASAVFRRAGAIWIIFDKAKRFNMEQIKDKAKNVILSADQVAAPRGTFLRLSVTPGLNPSIRRDGYAWVLDFKEQPMVAQTPIQAKLQRTLASGPRLFLSMVQVGDPIPFHDASVGDNLVVIPIIPLSNGIIKRHVYPEVRLLPTLQGFVIQPKIDDLRVRTTSKGVQIYSASKLSLSPPDPSAAAKSRIRTLSSLKKIFESDVWRIARLDGLKEFNKNRQALMAQIANAQGNAKQNARIKLAQFLFGQNFGYETLGILRRIRDDDPNIEESAGFRLLRGGSKFLIGRYEDADKDLNHRSLNESDEGQFWRAINQAGSGALVEASGTLKNTGRIILSYPNRIKIPLGLLIAEAAVRAGDVEFATNYLQMISEEEPSPKEVDQLAFVEGKLQQLVGEFDAAVEAWGSAAEGEHRPSVVQAIVRKIDLNLQRKMIKAKDAIKELERLRFSWRGDDLELNILRKLGKLYFQVEDYRNGLRTLRSAASYFGSHPDAPKIAEEMTGAFVDLYLKDVADSMSAVQAIALFEEFKELTPAGEQGNVMIQKLADRLAQVDLLEKAAKLLTLQVEFRLEGEEKARVGARLATIRLINKQPGLAAEAITNSDEKDILPFLEAQRRQLLARSYIDQGLENKALGVLDTDNSRYADLLRAEIYWKAQAWPQTSRVLQRLITAIGAQPNQKLNERQALYVVNQAVSMALGGDERGTDKLVRDYGIAMDQTSFKDAFRLIASPDATGLIDFRSVSDKVTTVSNFKNFMASYEKRLKKGELSKIN